MSTHKPVLFVSYSSKDKRFVERLVTDLKKRKITVWEYSLDIVPGDSIPYKISQALLKADYFGIVLSPNSAKSKWVERELDAALTEETKRSRDDFVLPVLYKDVERPPLIAGRRYADFRGDYRSGFDELLKGLARAAVTTHRPLPKATSPKRSPSVLFSLAKDAIDRKRGEMQATHPDLDLGRAEGDPQEVGLSKEKPTAIAQFYEHGIIVWHTEGAKERNAFLVHGGIWNYYRAMGEDRWKRLGLPVADEQEAHPSPYANTDGEPNKGRYSLFGNGEIVWRSSGRYRDQAYAVWDPIRKVYDALGGSGSFLGFPISEPYEIRGGERCDFEGGAILSLETSTLPVVVRQLLRLDYSDSPLNHDWEQYAGPKDGHCLAVRHDTKIGAGKSYVAFNFPWDGKAVMFPCNRFTSGELREKYCGMTVRSLAPGSGFRLFIKVHTNAKRPQILKFDTDILEEQLTYDADEGVDYWHVPLPAECRDGNWHTVIINLEKHVQEGFTRAFESTAKFYFRGYVGVADIVVSSNRDAIERVTINSFKV